MCAYSRVAPWWRRERSGEMVTAATSGVVGQCERVCSCQCRCGVCSVGTPAQNSSEVSSATVTENQPRDTRKSTSRGGAPIRAGDARRMQRRRRGRTQIPATRASPPALPLPTSLLDHVDSTPTWHAFGVSVNLTCSSSLPTASARVSAGTCSAAHNVSATHFGAPFHTAFHTLERHAFWSPTRARRRSSPPSVHKSHSSSRRRPTIREAIREASHN